MPPVANKPQIIAATRRARRLVATGKLGIRRCIESDAKTAHRRAYRTGVPSKLAIDSQTQAFVERRLDTPRFGDIAQEVAEHFPPERHVSRSSIHRWWQKLRRV